MKKLFALILAVLMVASLVACAPAAPQTTTAPKATQPAGTQPAGTTAPATTEAPVDLSALPFVEPGSVKIVIGIQTNATVLDYHDNAFTKYLEESTGIDIDFMFFSSDKGEAQQQLNLMVAGKEKLPDIITGFLDQVMINELAADGWLCDLTPFYDQKLHYHMNNIFEIATDEEKAVLWGTITDADGKIWCVPSMTGGGTIDSCHIAGALNRTWAEKFGMKVEEIDTVEELHDYLTKCITEDPNGNGIKDEMGLVGSMKSNRNNYELYVLNAYVFLNDTFLWNVTDGEVWAPHTTDEYRQGIIELNKWYKEGLISPLSYSIKEHAEQKALIETPELYKVAGWFGHPTLVCNSGSEIGAEYQATVALKDETGSGVGGYWPRNATTKLSVHTAISASCEHPELAFRLLDFICSPYSNKVSRYGEEGVTWKLLDPEESKAQGKFTSTGIPAGIEVIKDEWSEETKQTWHTGVLNCESQNGYEAGLFIAGGASVTNPKSRGAISMDNYKNALETGEPAQVVKNLVYNEEEQEVIDTYQANYKAYMKEARAEFITGAKDPTDDAQWNAYLKELEQNGLEDLLEAVQTSWERMQALAGTTPDNGI